MRTFHTHSNAAHRRASSHQMPHTFRHPKHTRQKTPHEEISCGFQFLDIENESSSFYACAKMVEYYFVYLLIRSERYTANGVQGTHLTHSNVNARHLFAAVECLEERRRRRRYTHGHGTHGRNGQRRKSIIQHTQTKKKKEVFVCRHQRR